MIEEQEILACLSDILIEVYLAESAVLRALKAEAARSRAPTMRDLTLVFVNDAAGRMEQSARQALAAISEGDELRGQLGLARRLLKWLPLNTVALRRRIAQRLCETGNYPALLAEK